MKPTRANRNLHENSNDHDVRLLTLPHQNPFVMNTMFPHRNIHKHARTFLAGKTHNHIDHILVEMIWYSSTLDVGSFRGADCDTDHYLIAANVRERLLVSKQVASTFEAKRSYLKYLSDLEVRKKNKIKIPDRV